MIILSKPMQRYFEAAMRKLQQQLHARGHNVGLEELLPAVLYRGLRYYGLDTCDFCRGLELVENLKRSPVNRKVKICPECLAKVQERRKPPTDQQLYPYIPWRKRGND